MQRTGGCNILLASLITGECDFEWFGRMLMGICANGQPYKINGGQEVSILNSRMLAKGISTWKDDAWVNTLPVFSLFLKSIILFVQVFS